MLKKNKGRPTQDEAGRLTEHLVTVAGALFEEEGFSAVSMNRIAAGAGVGKDTLYSRFANKEALFFAVIERQAKQHRSTCPSLAGSAISIEAALRQYGHWLVHASSSPGAISRSLLFYREGQRFAKLGEIFSESYDAMFIAPVQEYFSFQKDQGHYPDLTAERVARLFCDLVLSTLNNRLIISHDLPNEQEVALHVEAVAQLFTKGMA